MHDIISLIKVKLRRPSSLKFLALIMMLILLFAAATPVLALDESPSRHIGVQNLSPGQLLMDGADDDDDNEGDDEGDDDDNVCTDHLGCVTYDEEEPIRIASALLVEGDFAFVGLDSQHGIEIALDFRGELFGHPLELVAHDSGCSSEGGEPAANAIVADTKVVAVVGTSCSGSATAAAPIISGAGYVMVSPSSTAPSLTDPKTHEPGYLRTAWNDKDQGVTMANFLRSQGATTSAVVVDGSPYSQALGQAFVDTFENLGGQNIAFEVIEPGNETDIGQKLQSIANAGPPQALYFPVFMPDGLFIVTQARGNPAFDSTLLAATDALAFPEFPQLAGADAEGMFFSVANFNFPNPDYANVFLPEYIRRFGEPLFVFHAHAYDATNMILDAIESVAVVEDDDDDATVQIGRQALRDALFDTKDFGGLTGDITCDPSGDCSATGFLLLTVQNGELVLASP